MSRIKTYLQLLVLLPLLITGCSKSENKTIAIDYLLPQFRDKPVHLIGLSSAEGATKLIRQENGWWVDKPVDYYADQGTIENFLRILTDTEIGKKVNIAPADFHRLDVDDDSGIKVQLKFGENEALTLIVGKLDFPDDTSTSGLLGPGHSARRYIRVIADTDEVYLTPISFIDLSAVSALWTSYSIVRVPSFQRILIKSGDEVAYEFYRNHMYGPIYSRESDGRVIEQPPGLFECFEEFLKIGECFRMGNIGTSFQANETLQGVSFTVDDFLGMSYMYRLGSEKDPSEEEEDRAALAMGILNNGIASSSVPFTMSFSVKDVELNPFEESLKKQNLIIAKRMANRVIYTELKKVYCLFNLFEDLK